MSIQPLSNNMPTAYAAPTPTADAGKQAAGTTAAQAAAARAGDGKAAAGEAQSSIQPDKKSVLDAAEQANLAIAGLPTDLKFTVDEDTGTPIVRIVDRKTKELIRQIPAQEMLEIRKHLDELRGLLIKEKA